MAASVKTTAGLLLVVILASSIVMGATLVFSAEQIADRADDLSVRMEVAGERMVLASQKGDVLGIAAPIAEMLREMVVADDDVVYPLRAGAPPGAMSGGEGGGEENEGELSWSRAFDDDADDFAVNNTANSTNSQKAVILAFDDGWKSQYHQAKPILDKYGFKATFSIVCGYIGYDSYMTWREIRDLHNSGHDIQSHSMQHRDLTKLSAEELDYELGASKQCLHEHGIDATVFATPYNRGWDNATVIEGISKYYELAKNGNDRIMYLSCDGWTKMSNQTDCRTFEVKEGGVNATVNGGGSKELTYANRYSIRAWSHNYYDDLYDHNDLLVFEKFVESVNAPYRTDPGDAGKPPGIVVLEYHKVDNERTPTSTSPELFDAEMRYLHDNGFLVLTMSDLRYDENAQRLLIPPTTTAIK
ncbi:MAG TPA: polysaccharide deacetylase family protein [Nitrososphaera sp.]|jgi:peptidoglycan/xylan/chitin deacetylase (PgdA/CDA1 family)